MLALILVFWTAIALGLGASGVLRNSLMPPPAIALLLTILVLAVVWLAEGLRTRIRALGAGPLVAVHVTRLVIGIYFLLLERRGALPAEFAQMAGWGDIVVGAAALGVLATCVPAERSGQRLGLLAWNTLGLADILLVLGNGMRLFALDPEIGGPFTTLPLALLPTLIVPLVISTHLWLFAWGTAPTSPLATGEIVQPPPEDET